jgi:hypothetical protein
VSLLESVRKTPPAEGLVRATVITSDSPGATVTPDAKVISAPVVIVTFARVLPTFGTAGVAVMIAEPAARHVIGTLTLVAFGVKLTFEGTVATPVLAELREIDKPLAGAGADKISVRF